MPWRRQELSRQFLAFRHMNIKIISLSIIVISIIIAGLIMFSADKATDGQIGSNVSVIDGKQIITINAKGGYSPKVTTAKAGIPTVIKMSTQGTFDCASALTIPSLGYRKNLPPSGEALIDVPPQKSGAVIQGVCAMGMYNFQVQFN